MFSLHIDTASTWRGGQSQVRYTVLGLRAIGHRAALAADPEGELFARMSEGLDLIPLLIEMTIWGSRRHPDPAIPVERAERMGADRDGTVRAYRERLTAEREAAVHA